MDRVLLAIAKTMGFDTLEERKSDRLDFKEVAVWRVKAALEAAYEAGRRAADAQLLRALRALMESEGDEPRDDDDSREAWQLAREAIAAFDK